MEIKKKTLLQVFLGIGSCILLFWLLHETERVKGILGAVYGILSPFILGAVLAFILNVPVRAFERMIVDDIPKPGARRLTAIVLTFAALILVLAIVFLLLIPQISQTVKSLVPKVYDFFIRMEAVIREFLNDNPELMQWISDNTEFEKFDWNSIIKNTLDVLSNSVTIIANSAVSAIGGIVGAVVDLIIGLVFALYALFRKEILARQGRRILYAFLPEKVSDNIIRILRLTNNTFSNFISGQCLEACILGGMFAVAMTVLRMPYVPLISVLIAVTALVPLVGAFIGCFLGAFFILVDSPLMAVTFVVMFLILQQIEGNLIYPKVVGNSIGLPGMWVLVAVSVGGDLMGIMGMLIMIPLASVCYTLLREITTYRLTQRGIPEDKLQEQPMEITSKLKEKRQKKLEERRNKVVKPQAEQEE